MTKVIQTLTYPGFDSRFELHITISDEKECNIIPLSECAIDTNLSVMNDETIPGKSCICTLEKAIKNVRNLAFI